MCSISKIFFQNSEGNSEELNYAELDHSTHTGQEGDKPLVRGPVYQNTVYADITTSGKPAEPFYENMSN